MKIFWKLLWIAFLFFASLALIVAGMAVFVAIGLVLLLLNRRAGRSLTQAPAPDVRIYSNADGTLVPQSPETANAR